MTNAGACGGDEQSARVVFFCSGRGDESRQNEPYVVGLVTSSSERNGTRDLVHYVLFF
ncbi:hypothetical protein [Stieleria varia]|uniref:Uncharacterized protein n=1 Tax=Stieleria varia TaxID=2528005 RepID=A0A5C6A8U6_9BACT|nr:hypothetical protein [Stieleria varia]TWT94723.1 hypothetical protein Pla52n_55480 [Stieleria varia]